MIERSLCESVMQPFWQVCVLLFASAGVFHHSGIKIPYFAFFAHDSGRREPGESLRARAIRLWQASSCGHTPDRADRPASGGPSAHVFIHVASRSSNRP